MSARVFVREQNDARARADVSLSDDSERDQDLEREAPRRLPWWLHPAAVASLLTVACLPLGASLPRLGLDPSWQLGLSLAHVRGIAAGPGFVFTYGPLGFLAYPNIVWLPGAVFGLLYVVASTFALYYFVCRGLLAWLTPLAAIVLSAAFALVTLQVGSVAELADRRRDPVGADVDPTRSN